MSITYKDFAAQAAFLARACAAWAGDTLTSGHWIDGAVPGDMLARFGADVRERLVRAGVDEPTANPWRPASERPAKSGFYEGWCDVPPQSHPLQAVQYRFDGGRHPGWATSWPVLYWRSIERPPGVVA